MEDNESVDAKTPAQDDRFIRAVEKRVKEYLQGNARVPDLLALILRKAGY